MNTGVPSPAILLAIGGAFMLAGGFYLLRAGAIRDWSLRRYSDGFLARSRLAATARKSIAGPSYLLMLRIGGAICVLFGLFAAGLAIARMLGLLPPA